MAKADYSAAVLAAAGLLHYYPLEETAGTNAADSAPAGAIAATWGSTNPTVGSVIGPDNVAKAAHMNAGSGNAGILNSAFTFPKDHTVCYWIKLDAQTQDDSMSFEWAPAGFGQFVQHDIGSSSVMGGSSGRATFTVYFGGAGGTAVYCNRSLFTGVWQFLAITHDSTLGANAMRIYLDGVDVTNQNAGNVSQAAQTPTSAKAGIMGRWTASNSLNMQGAMAGLAIFNRALTQTQVKALRSAMGLAQIVDPGSGAADSLNYNAFPGHCLMPNGNVLVAEHHANDHIGDGTNKLNYAIGVPDGAGGFTFGAWTTLRTTTGNAGGTPGNIGDLSCMAFANGKVGILWNESSTPGLANINTDFKMKLALSSDNAATFGAPIVSSVPGFATNAAGVAGAYGVAPCPIVQIPAGLPNAGRWLLPVYGFDDKTNTAGYGIEYVKLFYSDNEGTSWTYVADIFPKTALRNYDETCIVFLGSTLVAYSRTDENGNPTIRTRRSTDQGATWDTDTRLLGTGASTTGYGGRPAAARHPNGRVYLTVRYMNASLSSWSQYFVSSDNGITFDGGHQLLDDAAPKTGQPTGGSGPYVYAAWAVLGNGLSCVWAEELGATSAVVYQRNVAVSTGGGTTRLLLGVGA